MPKQDKTNQNPPLRKRLACESVGTHDTILTRAACVVLHPGKMLLFPFVAWFEKRYAGRYRFSRLVFALDLLLIGFAIGLLVVGAIFAFRAGHTIEDDIVFGSTVAPAHVRTGASSTLVIQFRNDSEYQLEDVRLHLTFPDHFLRQAVLYKNQEIEHDTINVGTVTAGGTGSIKIRGVMFGDVGGKQTFKSVLQFTYPGDNRTHYKSDEYVFSPAKSALNMSLRLPDRLMAFQPFEGVITYNNTGPIAFPEIVIRPEWPRTFTLTDTDIPLTNDTFHLPGIDAGESGELRFTGVLGDEGERVTFKFHPRFRFEDAGYKQDTLVHTSPIIPPQIDVAHSLKSETLRPGTTATFTVTYENTGDTPVGNVRVGIEIDSPFFTQERYLVDQTSYPELARVAPGDGGAVQVRAPLRATIPQSTSGPHENLRAISRGIATYTLADETVLQATSKGDDIVSPITTPIVFRSFGRYSTPTGDQLGRGPLPPRVGEETSYWIFWNLRGTTNTLNNVRIEGQLPSNVRFTGRQTVSRGDAVTYTPSTRTVTWSDTRVAPTLDPATPILGIAFEVAVTPTRSQIETPAPLLENVRLTGTDANTGAFISASGPTVSTQLPNDRRADGNGTVTE